MKMVDRTFQVEKTKPIVYRNVLLLVSEHVWIDLFSISHYNLRKLESIRPYHTALSIRWLLGSFQSVAFSRRATRTWNSCTSYTVHTYAVLIVFGNIVSWTAYGICNRHLCRNFFFVMCIECHCSGRGKPISCMPYFSVDFLMNVLIFSIFYSSGMLYSVSSSLIDSKRTSTTHKMSRLGTVLWTNLLWFDRYRMWICSSIFIFI